MFHSKKQWIEYEHSKSKQQRQKVSPWHTVGENKLSEQIDFCTCGRGTGKEGSKRSPSPTPAQAHIPCSACFKDKILLSASPHLRELLHNVHLIFLFGAQQQCYLVCLLSLLNQDVFQTHSGTFKHTYCPWIQRSPQ